MSNALGSRSKQRLAAKAFSGYVCTNVGNKAERIGEHRFRCAADQLTEADRRPRALYVVLLVDMFPRSKRRCMRTHLHSRQDVFPGFHPVAKSLKVVAGINGENDRQFRQGAENWWLHLHQVDNDPDKKAERAAQHRFRCPVTKPTQADRRRGSPCERLLDHVLPVPNFRTCSAILIVDTMTFLAFNQ